MVFNTDQGKPNSIDGAAFNLVSQKLKPIRTKFYIIISQWELKVKTSKLDKVRENANGQVAFVLVLHLIS